MKVSKELNAGAVVASETPLLASLKARAHWQWIRRYLQSHDIKPGTGWAAVMGTLTKKDDAAADLLSHLQSYYDSVRLAGNRYVQLFDLAEDISTAILPSLKNAIVPDSKFSESYPYLLDDKKLLTAPSDLTLCEVISANTNDYLLVFCSRRDYVEREVFEGSAATAITTAVSTLAGYDSIVGLKTKCFQAYDVVAIRPGLKRIEVLVDLPIGHPLDADRVEHALKLLFATSLHLPGMKEIAQGQTPTNLFPAIDAIYKEKAGGILQFMKLRTSTGIIDSLATVLEEDDLRVNKYHTSSAESVNNEIELFQLTTRMPLSMPEGQVLIKLASTVRTLAAPPDSRWLHGMEILECASQVDIVRAINKVVSFLG